MSKKNNSVGDLPGPSMSKCTLNEQTAAYVSKVLKSQLGKNEDFLIFERQFYYQLEELSSLKSTVEQLNAAVAKLQEEKRCLELEVVSLRVSRDQEAKNAVMEVEKNKVQKNAEIYSIKCETETWKRKAEAAGTECSWLKEQMKTVEMEKNQAVLKVAELKSNLNEFERCRRSFESYSRRQKELVMLCGRKIGELERAKESLGKITEGNQKQLDKISSQLRNWSEERAKLIAKNARLERELMQTIAESAQNKAKLARAEKMEKQSVELVEKLVEENKDLRNGLSILSKAVGDQINETDQLLLEKTNSLHQQIDESIERLSLKESHFAGDTTSATTTT